MGQTQAKDKPPKHNPQKNKPRKNKHQKLNLLKGKGSDPGVVNALDRNKDLTQDYGTTHLPPVREFKEQRPPSVPPPTNTSDSSGSPSGAQDDPSLFLVLHSYEAGDENQLTITKGELIRLIIFEDTSEWCLGQNSKGDLGWLPCANVTHSASMDRYDWYHGSISRSRAEYLLNSGVNGSYLVRESESYAEEHCLSLRYLGEVYHYLVKSEGSMLFAQEEYKFSTIPELIDFYSHDPGGLITKLRYPIPRLDNPPGYTLSPMADELEWEISRTNVFICQKLSGGQFGEYCKAIYRKYNPFKQLQTVAVNILKEKITVVAWFMKRADMLQKIKHPNIVQLIGVCTLERPIYIITEFMARGNLLDYLQSQSKKDLPPTTLLYMAKQVAAAMEHLETIPLIHRDLAARNCLVGENNWIKVANFGFARAIPQDYYIAHAEALLPIQWTAPETLAYYEFSTKSDVWAFGILMWEMTTYGMSPYQRRDIHNMYTLLEKGYRLKRPDGCPDAAYSLMTSCWKWDPDRRPTFKEIRNNLDTMFSALDLEEVDCGHASASNLEKTKSSRSDQPLLDPKAFLRGISSSQETANDEQAPNEVCEVAGEANYSDEESLQCTLPERDVNGSEYKCTTQNPVQRTTSSEIETRQEQTIPPEVEYWIKKGYCLIINNENFVKKAIDNKILSKRAGSSVDRAKLENTFQWLGFEVRVIDDAKVQEVRNAFTEINYSIYDSFVCFILSHGFSKGFYTSDGKYILYDDLRSQFCGSTNKCLLGKPKLFFIQACRGNNLDFGSLLPDSPTTELRQEVLKYIPNDADFLFAYSATPGKVSWRSESEGTWFISTLCQVLRDRAHELDLNRMLVIANSNLSEENAFREDSVIKQSGDHHSSLRRIIYFSPVTSWQESKFFQK